MNSSTSVSPSSVWWWGLGLAWYSFLGGWFQVSDVDVGYHMRTAMHMLAGGGIPATNTFSSTCPDEPWLLHQWLGTLIFYLPYAWGGVVGLVTFKALVGAGLMVLTWLSARRLAGSASIWPLLTVTLALLACRPRFFERSDLLSALLFTGLLFQHGLWQRSRRWWLLVLPLYMALWANVHAGVIYGAALLCLWLGLAMARQLSTRFHLPWPGLTTADAPLPLWVLGAGLALSLVLAMGTVQVVNPNGCKVLWFPISQFASPFWQTIIVEYQRPNWHTSPFFLIFAGVFLLVQLCAWRRTRLDWLVVCLAFGFLAIRSQRSIHFFVIAATPYLAWLLEQLLASGVDGQSRFWLRGRAWTVPALWALVVGLVLIPDRTLRFGPGFYRPYYPVEIFDFLKREVPPQNLFNDMQWGGTLCWWLYPQFKPYIDGRGDAYTETFWQQEYFPVLNVTSNWSAILARHRVEAILLVIPELGRVRKLAETLRAQPEWALVAMNDDTQLFLKRTTNNAGVIARHEYKWLWPGDWGLTNLAVPERRAEFGVEARRAFELSPDSLFAQTAQARVLMEQADYAAAAAILGRIVQSESASVAHWRDYGFCLFQDQQLEAAANVFARLLRRNQIPGFARYMRHFLALKQRDVATARAELQAALALEPANGEYQKAWENLARIPVGPAATNAR
jgi:hypothetical protein